MAVPDPQDALMVTFHPKVDKKNKNRVFAGSTILGDQTFDAVVRNHKEDKLPIKIHCDITVPAKGKPKQTFGQTFEVSQDSWRRYTYPLKDGEAAVSRAPAVAFSKDLECIRAGLDVFKRSEDGSFKPVRLGDGSLYIEDVDSQGQFLAVARRNLVVKTKLADQPEEDKTESAEKTDEAQEANSAEQAKPSSTSNAEDSPPTPRSLLSQEGDLLLAQGASLDLKQTKKAVRHGSDSESSSSESESEIDSAVEWCSVGDTDVPFELFTTDDAASSEDSEDALYEDPSGLPDEEGPDIKIESDVEEDAQELIKIEKDAKSSKKQLKKKKKRESSGDDKKAQDTSSDSDGLKSDLSDDYDSDDENDSDSSDIEGDDEYDEELEEDDDPAYDYGKRKQAREEPSILQIYDAAPSPATLIFQTTTKPQYKLYSSAPVFHPSQPMLVWPMGDNKILFVDYQENTYFTCLLGTSTLGSRQIMIKSHFSAQGAFLHLAALEVSLNETTVVRRGRTIKKPKGVRLNLQVTTHRLSRGKPTKSPPILVSRENCPLDNMARVDMADFPWVLRWQEESLSVVSKNEKDEMKVKIVPLFPAAKGETSKSEAEVFSPVSTLVDHGAAAAEPDARSTAVVAGPQDTPEVDKKTQKQAEKMGMKATYALFMRDARPVGRRRPGAGKLRDPAETFITSGGGNVDKFVA